MTKAMRQLAIAAVGMVVATPGLIGQTAPSPNDPALTVDKQIHLGTDGALVKEGSLLLWGGNTNTGVGKDALSSTSGSSNTAVGSGALTSNTTGTFNTAVGDSALASNEGGERNTAVGGFALNRNVSGSYNTAIGLAAMEYNTTGHHNTALGAGALVLNLGEVTPGDNYGSFNTALGTWALQNNTYGSRNTAVGYFALQANESGYSNTAVGYHALRNNTSGTTNSAIGYKALESNTSGHLNIAIGNVALQANLSGNENIAIGSGALYVNQYGLRNTGVGGDALMNSSGSHSVGLGYGAGKNATTGNQNIFILNDGNGADTNTIRIGTAFDDQGDADPANDTGQMITFVAGIEEQTLSASAAPVCVESTGQLGKCAAQPTAFRSSRRYKQEIRDLMTVTERLEALRPVTFRFRKEVAGTEQALEYGLIAEEVAEVFPELVVFDDEGRPEAVKYRFLSSILLAEVKRQAEELTDLRTRLRAIEERLN